MTIPKLRWVIAALLLLATMLNYIDRLTLSVVITDLRKSFAHRAGLFADYQSISCGVCHHVRPFRLPCGRLGTRKGFAAFMLGWSLPQLLHDLVRGKWSLAYRLMLGPTEPGNFPAAVKMIAEWFPLSQRAIGVGIFSAGSSLDFATANPDDGFPHVRYA